MRAAYQAVVLYQFVDRLLKDSTETEYFTTLWNLKTNNTDTDNDNELRAMAISIIGHVAHIMYLWASIHA